MQQHYHTEALARRTIHDHAAILAAITARNPDSARMAMHRHLARVVREFQRGGNSKAKVATKSNSRAMRPSQFNGKGGMA
jgi:DNA-binding GntR family transcriptional regulator